MEDYKLYSQESEPVELQMVEEETDVLKEEVTKWHEARISKLLSGIEENNQTIRFLFAENDEAEVEVGMIKKTLDCLAK